MTESLRTLNREAVKRLREPFPSESIGKLPRISCRDCSQSQQRVCGKHQKSKCQECGNWITTAHIHLDYVGHAETTDRLLSVDPMWTWEPAATDDNGNPDLVCDNKGNPVGLWIKLTVLGVTRYGYGSVEPGKFDATKELIGDALRNAAMRFGVALDLWAKGELESALVESSDGATSASTTNSGTKAPSESSKAKSPQGEPAKPVPTASNPQQASTTSPRDSEGVEAEPRGSGPAEASSEDIYALIANALADKKQYPRVLAAANKVCLERDVKPEKGIDRKTVIDLPEDVLEQVASELHLRQGAIV